MLDNQWLSVIPNASKIVFFPFHFGFKARLSRSAEHLVNSLQAINIAQCWHNACSSLLLSLFARWFFEHLHSLCAVYTHTCHIHVLVHIVSFCGHHINLSQICTNKLQTECIKATLKHEHHAMWRIEKHS